MTHHLERSTPLSILNEAMTEEYRTTVVRRCLEHLGQVSPPTRRCLQAALRKQIKLPGFSDPNQALKSPKRHLLLSEVINASYRSDVLMGTLLRVWDESHPELHQAILAFLQDSGDPPGEPVTIDTAFPRVWPQEHMLAVAATFVQAHTSFVDDDAALMMCYVYGRAPIPDELMSGYDFSGEAAEPSSEEVQDTPPGEASPPPGISASKEAIAVQLTTTVFQDMLTQLVDLPPDAREWDELPVFTERLQSLRDAKLAAREQSRDQLQHALDALFSEAGVSLAWWGKDVTAWSADRCPWAQANALAQKVQEWQAALLQHEHLRQPSSRAEELARRSAKEALEVEIERGHSELSAVLGPDAPGPVAPRSGSATAPVMPPQSTAEAQDAADECAPAANAADSGLIEGPGLHDLIASPEETEPAMAPEATAGGADVFEPVLTDGAEIPEAPSDSDAEGPAPEAPIAEEPTQRVVAGMLAEELAQLEAVPDLEQSDLEEKELAPVATTEIRGLEPTQAVNVAALLNAIPDERIETEPAPTSDEGNEAWQDLFCQKLAEDDLTGAYWLTRSRIAGGLSTPVADWLLAAVQGARFVAASTPGLARDLHRIAHMHAPDDDSPAQEMLATAAAAYAILVAPSSDFLSWLRHPSVCAGLRPLVAAIESFAGYNVSLHPEDALGVAGEEQRAEAIQAAALAARRWLDEAPTRRKRVSSVWRSLIGPKGTLRDLLRPVCENRQNQLDDVYAALARWQDRSAVYDHFDEINAAGSPGKPQRVTGAGKQDLYREVEEAVDLTQQWCDLVRRAQEIRLRGDWFRDQVTALRNGVEQALPVVDAELRELTQNGDNAILAASARVLQVSLWQIRDLLDLPASIEHDNPADHPAAIPSFAADSIDAMLTHRLLWLPEVPLTNSGQPTPEGLQSIPSALRAAQSEERTLLSAAGLWIARQDYRFVDRILSALPDEASVIDVQQRLNEALGASRAALRADITSTGNLIDQALLDEAINDEQRATYVSTFGSLSLEEVRNYKAKFAELERVRQDIRGHYQDRLQHLREQYDLVGVRLRKSDIAPDLQDGALAFIAAALEQKDVRVVVESLARLNEVLDTGADLPRDWYAPASGRDCLAELNAVGPDIERLLEYPRNNLRSLASAARDGVNKADIPFNEIRGPNRKEAAEALLSWSMLKQQSAKGNHALPIMAVLRYLGFSLRTGDATSIEILGTGADWLHARAAMSAGDLARPIPEFGSQAQERYDVVCLWERPGADTIASRLRDLHVDLHTVIVVYLGRITARQKRDVLRVSRDQGLAIAVLDETLLVFLAREREERLPAFLRCALPFSALNPYRPFQAGDVPPEMFFGRAGMARELQRQGGSCLVYGGRQLGKSALLRHVQRQFHHPELEQFAWVENMKLLFDPSAGKTADHVWRSLREGFKTQKLLDPRSTSDRPDEIARYIRESMRARPRQRVLVMLDEADSFLDADAREGFRTVLALRDLMLDSGQRFKVIFAGLQGVQRFQGIPDQPLAHFGTPLCVGPLEPGEAQLLVRQPLEVLGYRFADNGAVLRILSYTNYHPGLIQYFCQELLGKLRKGSGSALPPYRIQQEDIESLYLTQKVRDHIRERFEWTLALDTHYQAIAWTLIEHQIKDHDGFARAYPPSDILDLVRDWWPAGFEDTGIDQLRGWLDELCGLGVLVRNVSGHYRLRSPNMVQLLGRETHIDDRLQELMTKSPVPVMEADSHHALLDEQAIHYSPLTFAEERGLSQPRFGVGLVFASEAQGLGFLSGAIRRFLPVGLPTGTGDCTTIPGDVAASDLEGWLKEYLKSQAKTERMILYQRVSYAPPNTLAELVNQAQRFCHRHQARDRWMRILFLFDPQSTWQWLGMPEEERTRIEEAADAVLWPRPWTLSAIRRRLAQHDKFDTDDVGSKEALHVTAGWPWLLDELFRRCGKDTDIKPSAQKIERDLATPDSELRQAFSSALGIATNETAQHVMRFVLDEGQAGQILDEWLTPELIGGSPELTRQDCSRAKEFVLRLGVMHLRQELLTVDPVVLRVTKQA